MRRGALDEALTLGGRVPPVVGGLVVALVGCSALGALTGLTRWAVLYPALVLEGEIWRLLTWTLVDGRPWSIIFSVLMLLFLPAELVYGWGPRRFLATWLGIGVASGAVCTLVALLFPRLETVGLGAWAPIFSLWVAEGLLYPERRVRLFLTFETTGRGLVWVTIGLTVFLMAFDGIAAHLPELAAEGLMIVWLRGLSPRGAWQRLRIWLGARRLRRRARHLHVAKGNGKGDPPRWLN